MTCLRGRCSHRGSKVPSAAVRASHCVQRPVAGWLLSPKLVPGQIVCWLSSTNSIDGANRNAVYDAM